MQSNQEQKHIDTKQINVIFVRFYLLTAIVNIYICWYTRMFSIEYKNEEQKTKNKQNGKVCQEHFEQGY